MPQHSTARRAITFGLPVALTLSLVAATAASSTATAAPVPAAEQKVQAQSVGGETIVGLGDSYMSGEGVMISNHNFPKGDPGCEASNWQMAPGALGNAILCLVTASYTYDAKSSSAEPGGYLITPSTSTTNGSRAFRSVFGDANGWPESQPSTNPMGVESTPYCDRSFAAAAFIGAGWTTKNFACSGATQPNGTATDKAFASAFSKPEFNYGKPGITFGTFNVKAPFPQGFGTLKGQAQLLEDYAKSNDDISVVALSIGGNDFGFGKIGKACITDGSLGGKCEEDPEVLKDVAAGIPLATKAVRISLENIVKAMKEAGYDDGSYKIVYQNPPLPVAEGSQTKYEWEGVAGGTRASIGGCGLADSTFNWIVNDLYKDLRGGLRKGILQAQDTLQGAKIPVVQLDTTDTFNGHRLCEKGTQGAVNYQANQAGRTPPWQDNNGKGTEWVTYVSRSAAIFGNVYQASMPLHPNYWGQRALASCINRATDVVGSVTVACTQDDGEGLNAQGQPQMNLSGPNPLWIDVVGSPQVMGIPNVGRTVTADTTGVFTPDVNYSFSYQWLLDGVEIDGATAKTYAIQAGDVGKALRVRVRAEIGDDAATAVSDPVSVSDLTVVTKPAISGQAKVGDFLNVTDGTYSVSPDGIGYQWLADGEEIPGETTNILAVTPGLVGKRISVRLTVVAAGFEDLVLNTSETGPVAPATMSVTGRPTISGPKIVGKTLSASISGVTFAPTPDRVSYQWFRNGSLIKGADTAQYELTGDDVGTAITVRVLGYKDGYTDARSAASVATSKILKGVITTTGKPRLMYGTPSQVSPLKVKGRKVRYGRQVSADIWDVFSEWPTPADVTWFRKTGDGPKKIKSATDDYTWTPKPSDIGTRVRVRVETGNEGYEQASATTVWYKVVKGKYATVKAPKVKGKPKVGKTLVAKPARFLPPAAGKVQYRWFAGGKRVKGANGRTLKLTMAQKGKNVRVQAYIKPSATYLASQVKSAPVGPVRAVKGLG